MLPESIPGSTVFIFMLAAAITFLMSLANRLFSDPEKIKAWRKEVQEYSEQLRRAQKRGDKKQIDKLMKKQQYILQLNQKISWQSMKVTFLFIIPLFVVWQFLGAIYGPKDIAYFPGVGPTLPIPLFGVSLYWWYLLCSFLFNAVFSHLLGLLSVE